MGTTDQIIITNQANRTRVAALDKKRTLVHYDEESIHSKMEKNSIYNGEIKSLRPELNAVFVRYDKDKKDGFLPFDNVAPKFYQNHVLDENGKPDVSKCLRVGQKLIVQVKKDQLSHDSKGAALTTFLSLAGTYLVLLPENNKQGISRKADNTQRDQVKDLLAELAPPEDIGLIIRTAGINRSITELTWDFTALMRQYELIVQTASTSPTPALLHEEDNIISRNIRDNISPSTQKIITDNQAIFDNISTYLSSTRPEMLEGDRLELYTHEKPIYEHFGIEAQVESIFSTSIKLPSGGYIVVHGTEAGYMIDVNSGKSSSGKSIDETALSTNLEAAQATAQILKLRDVGGIIVIDFIDMNEKDHQRQVEQAMSHAIAHDRAKVKFESISQLSGCMLMLRQRLGVPYFESCLTTIDEDDSILMGKRRSVDSYANYILHIIENTAVHDTDVIQIQVSCEVATYLLNELRTFIESITTNHNVDIKIIPNANITTHRYTMKRFRIDNNEEFNQPKSYEQIIQNQSDKPWLPVHSSPKTPLAKATATQGTSTSHAHGQPHATKSENILQTIWNSLFGTSSKSSPDVASTKRHNPRKNNRRRHNRSARDGYDNPNKPSTDAPRERSGNRQGGNNHHSQRRRPNNNRRRNQSHQQNTSPNAISHFQDD